MNLQVVFRVLGCSKIQAFRVSGFQGSGIEVALRNRLQGFRASGFFGGHYQAGLNRVQGFQCFWGC